MPTATKKPSARKPAAKKAPPKRARDQHARKQMWAVVLFALGILLGAITIIPGTNMWKFLHDTLFGLFGWGVYFLSPLMIYIAVIAAMDKPLSSIKAKLWQMGILIVMISGAIQIFGSGLPDEGNFAKNISSLYCAGQDLAGGGVSGAVFAWPLIALFGKTGASITIVLAICVFVMLITGSSLLSLFQWITAPIRSLEKDYTGRVTEKQAEAYTRPAPKTLKFPERSVSGKTAQDTRSRFNIDVPIDNEPPFDASDTQAAQTGLTDSAGDFDVPEEQDMPDHPVIAEKTDVDDALDRLLAAANQDRPVEYVTPEEFSREHEESAVEAAEALLEQSRRHPLEDDIAQVLELVTIGAEGGDSNSDGGHLDFVGHFSNEKSENWDESGISDTHTPAAPAYEELPIMDPPAKLPVPYRYPAAGLLRPAKTVSGEDVTEELKANAQTLVDTLKSFGVQTRVTDICRGPAVTRYELQPSAGVKISKITGLSDDIALNLAAAGIRIEAPIPNKAAVGIEIPNKIVSIVSIREIIDSQEFRSAESGVTFALGKDIAGNITLADIARMPHMLIAGATGAGKSVCINSIIISLLYKSSPDDVKLLMIDPKVVELGIYNGIPHLLIPVVTDPKKAAGALGWAVTEMLNRYKAFAENSVRDLIGYNKLARTKEELSPMPQIVIIIDELADLMMVAPSEVEDSIFRLAAMARAAGMHLVIATQRPSVDVITGTIKANIPSRIAFAVSSAVDSRTILDIGGAEKLLGRGDMLYSPVGSAKPIRVQGCFVSETEVEAVVNYIKQDEHADYDQAIVEEIDRHVIKSNEKGKGGSKDDGGGFDDEDEMLPQAIECVVEMGQASTSALQRRLKLGYARAARIIDQLEEKGIVGPFEGSKPRQVLISKDRWIEMKLREDNQ